MTEDDVIKVLVSVAPHDAEVSFFKLCGFIS